MKYLAIVSSALARCFAWSSSKSLVGRGLIPLFFAITCSIGTSDSCRPQYCVRMYLVSIGMQTEGEAA